MTELPESQRELYAAAKAARDNAYSPYSGHKVGAAVRTSSGQIFAGCNVENSSYGGTVCAERTAIFTAVAKLGKVQLTEVLVVTDSETPWPPCGLCRQVIAEFATQGLKVHTANLHGRAKTMAFNELFPHAFTPDYLEKR